MKSLMNLGFKSLDGIVEKNTDKSVSFVAKRKGIGEKFFPENTCFTYESDEEISFEEYVVIEYSAFGLFRVDGVKPAFFSVKNENGWQKLFIYDDFTFDNRKHRVVIKAPEGKFSGIKADYFVDKILEAKFNLCDFYTCSWDELPPLFGTDNFASNADGMKKIDISDRFNGKYCSDEFDSLIDSGRFFDCENVSLFGVPFSVKVSGNNIVLPDAPPAENDDIIENFGAKAKRRECRPVSRDNETEIVINEEAKEIYFILSLSGKRHIRTRYGTNGEVLGSEYVDLFMPLCADDTEFFMAEVVYADGKHDTHLPLNLVTGKHGISGDISVYALPCDGTKVEKLVIHNRMLDTDVCLAAVTVNATDKRLFPEMLIPEKTETAVKNVSSEKGFFLDGTLLDIKNGAVSMKLELSRTLELLELTNDFAPDMKVEKGSMLLLRTAEGELCEEFDFKYIQHYENYAKIMYMYQGVYFDITVDISQKNSIRWKLEVDNMTTDVFKRGVIFPRIKGVNYGSFDENWYFVPKYQNTCSNETFYMYEESAPSFPMQFMDTFSPSANGGLCITTEEKQLVTRKYCLDKTGDTIEMYVEYPVMYGDYKPRERLYAPFTAISVHEGGWKAAFDMYKKWLDSWYTPYKCQNKQWYRECFWLLAEITDFFDCDEIYSFPCWYKKENDEFMFRKILEEQKSISGVYPDIIHMWSWCNMWRNGRYGQRWGNYGEEDYELYGGRENFKNALHDIRDNMGVQVSLYMHPTLLSNSYKKAEKFYKTSMVKTESGGTISIENDSFRMCHAEEGWRDETLSNYPRIYKELGIPLLYVDEFSLRIENRCYEDSHGHHVPSSLLKTDREFITRLKDSMPEEVVLYGEYAAVDVNARYIDCNISYYNLDSIVDMVETARRAGDGDDRLSRVFTNVYRFAFPKIVQLILPMAMRKISWHPQKFMFFNGEAVYDSFWDTEESRGAAFNVKAHLLKKKYADCFTSDCPETMIETESPAICMNKFPTENRTLYTVYNRAYSTYRGKVLRVPHKDGQTYYDAWNERMLDVEIKDGYAEISLEIDAMQMGCIVVE